jgi:hypothetical protein
LRLDGIGWFLGSRWYQFGPEQAGEGKSGGEYQDDSSPTGNSLHVRGLLEGARNRFLQM